MPVYIQCSSCQRKLRVRTELLGKNIRCPACRAKFLATAAEATAAPTEQEEMTPAEAGAADSTESMVAPPQLEDSPEASSGPTVRRPVAPEPAALVPQEAVAVRPPRAVPEPAPKEEVKPTAPAAAPAPVPYETPAGRVFLVLGLILLVVVLIGLAGAWVINANIAKALNKRAANVRPGPPTAQRVRPNSASALRVVCSASAAGAIPWSFARHSAV